MRHDRHAWPAHGFGGAKDCALASNPLGAIIGRLWCCEDDKPIDDNIDGIRRISDSEDELTIV